MKTQKGKYEVFEVGDELVFSVSRERGISKIKHRMSVDNVKELEKTTKKV